MKRHRVNLLLQDISSLEQKIDCVASELSGTGSKNTVSPNKKINNVASALAKANRKLDHISQDFTVTPSKNKRYQAA